MILFLDFDGVLHPITASDAEVFCRAPLLWPVLRQAPSIEIVLSTSWRFTHRYPELVTLATQGGGEDLADRFIGMTPKGEWVNRINSAERIYVRHMECQRWMQSNAPGRDWLALDDEIVSFPEECPTVHFCDPQQGLTPRDCEALLLRLRK